MKKCSERGIFCEVKSEVFYRCIWVAYKKGLERRPKIIRISFFNFFFFFFSGEKTILLDFDFR